MSITCRHSRVRWASPISSTNTRRAEANMTKCRFLILSTIILATTAPAAAKDREFHEVVARISDAYHTKPMHFIGLLSFAMRFAHPEGVSGIRLAIFDNIDPSLGPGARDLDGFLQRTLGPEFQPFVRVHSNRDGETTYVY